MSSGITNTLPSFEIMKNRMKSASNTMMNNNYFDVDEEKTNKNILENSPINTKAYNFQSQMSEGIDNINSKAEAIADDNDEKTDKDSKSKKKKDPNFGTFLYSTFLSVVYVLMYFCSGAIFLQYSDFYSDFKMNGRFPNEPPYTTSFPYVNMFSDSKNPMEENLISRFFNWITQSFIYSFSSGRFMLDKVLDFLGNTIKGAPQFVNSIIMLFAPLVVIGILLVSNIMGYINTIIGLFKNIELINPNSEELFLLIIPILIPLIIFIAAILFTFLSVSSIVALIQTIMLSLFFYVIPLINKDTRQATINKMLDNKYLIILTIFVFSTVNAFEQLDDTYGYVTLGMSLAALLVYLYMKFL